MSELPMSEIQTSVKLYVCIMEKKLSCNYII